MLSGLFERFADKREYDGRDRPRPTHGAGTATEDLWIDYVSDVGDGFDATATVAWMLAQDHLSSTTRRRSPRLGARPRW